MAMALHPTSFSQHPVFSSDPRIGMVSMCSWLGGHSVPTVGPRKQLVRGLGWREPSTLSSSSMLCVGQDFKGTLHAQRQVGWVRPSESHTYPDCW